MYNNSLNHLLTTYFSLFPKNKSMKNDRANKKNGRKKA